jgi:capsular polysaccharide biosynthesis glycosyltransferase
MRILYTTTIGPTMSFFKSIIKELIEDGHTVDIATNEMGGDFPVDNFFEKLGCKVFPISWVRRPLSLKNYKAIGELKNVLQNGYDIVHCHTPIAAACTRFACRTLKKKGPKLVYTAHGFHFYKGAPIKNWLFFYPIEKICSNWTDVLITINHEDFALAIKRFNASCVKYLPGVGIDIDKFQIKTVDKEQKRKELGVDLQDYLVFSAGELNSNKNHATVIKAIAQIKEFRIKYLIAGEGILKGELQKLIQSLEVCDKVSLLGFRKDIKEIYEVSDVYALPSIREGLNVSVMEAMASGLPCIVSNIRGNKDMIDKRGGILCSPRSIIDFSNGFRQIYHKNGKQMGEYNIVKAKSYSLEEINKNIKELYEEVMFNELTEK